MNTEYKLYPLPQEIDYFNLAVDLPKAIKIDTEINLSEAMLERFGKALASKSIELNDDASFRINLKIDPKLSKRVDAYKLKIEDNSISINAVNIFALYYGLNSLLQILDQCDDVAQSIEINDYADYPIRGIIEGYYGIPWGQEKRKSLIEFGSRFKMNVFAFAPKDDPYHREKWFDRYPQVELDEIDELARYAYDRGVVYYWTIAPFLKDEHEITFENKESSLQLILDKFEQLYNAGVRGFGVLGDDVGELDVETVVFLMSEINKWRKEKGDVRELMFCPEAYTIEDWAFKDGSELNYYDKHLDEDIHIFYTGIEVCSPLDAENIEAYKTIKTEDNNRRRDPLFWMNWPVNDIDHEEKRRLFMGPGEVYEPGIAEVTGVLTNPMEQAEASKTAIFATADYSWNAEAFSAEESWQYGFKYIEPACPEALHEITKHLASQEGRGAKNSAKESVQIELLEIEHKNAISEDDKRLIELKLKDAYRIILEAVDVYQENKSNLELYNEIEAFVHALRDKSEAAILYIDSISQGDKELLQEAANRLRIANDHKISSNTKNQLYAEPGAKVINNNIKYLQELVE